MVQLSGRSLAGIGVVVAVFAAVLALAAVGAPVARAADGACAVGSDADGVAISASGFGPDDRAAIRRNNKWVASIDADLVWSGTGSVDDDWKIRVRGPELPDPYLELACTIAPAGPSSCSLVGEAGNLSIAFDRFMAVDRLNVRRDGAWVASVQGDSPAVAVDGDAGDVWSVRARGAAFEEPYSTIECGVDVVVDPPDPEIPFCRVVDTGLKWDDAGADTYQVRREGKWVASLAEQTWATDDIEAAWVVRYRSGGVRIDESCERDGVVEPPVDADEPTCTAERNFDEINLTWDLAGLEVEQLQLLTGPSRENLISVAELADQVSYSSILLQETVVLRAITAAGESDIPCEVPANPFNGDNIGTCTATDVDGLVNVEWSSPFQRVDSTISIRAGISFDHTQSWREYPTSLGHATVPGAESAIVIRMSYLADQWDVPCVGNVIAQRPAPAGMQTLAVPFGALTLNNGSHVFVDARALRGYEVWIGDGSIEGSTLLVDAVRGAEGSGATMIATDGELVFFGADRSLWVTDGTPEGTVRLAAGDPRRGAVVDGRFVGSGFLEESGTLFSDGTANGTEFVAGIRHPVAFVEIGDGSALLFTANDALYRTDGTPNGTTQITPVGLTVDRDEFEVVGDKYFFRATNELGMELWVTNGTIAGTRLVKDITPGPLESAPKFLAGDEHGVWFAADSDEHFNELWYSDGTENGTVLLIGGTPGLETGITTLVGVIDGRVIVPLRASDDSISLYAHGSTPGSFDFLMATPVGADVHGIVVEGTAYFSVSGNEPLQSGLWTSDGTREGTQWLVDPRADLTQPRAHLGHPIWWMSNSFYELAD